jgi:hypothetical protein
MQSSFVRFLLTEKTNCWHPRELYWEEYIIYVVLILNFSTYTLLSYISSPSPSPPQSTVYHFNFGQIRTYVYFVHSTLSIFGSTSAEKFARRIHAMLSELHQLTDDT